MRVLRLEQSIERAVFKHAKKLGILYTKLTLYGSRGMPDAVFWLPSRPIFMEFKRPGETPDAHQAYIIWCLRALNYEVYIVDDAEKGKGILSGAKNQA